MVPQHIHDSTLYAVGKLIKVFGIKGELKIHSYGRSPEQYATLRSLYVGTTEKDAAAMLLDLVTVRGSDIYLKFQNISDRGTAESIVGKYLFVEEQDRKELSAGSFFIDDILGIAVVSETKEYFGVVKDVVKNSAHDIYVVQTINSDVMMPAVSAIIRSIDIVNRVMVVSPPDGLFNGDDL